MNPRRFQKSPGLVWRSTPLALILTGCLAAAGGGTAAPAGSPAPFAGERIVDFPPGPGNPRNSEGAFLDLRDGRILFVYSQFTGASLSDHAKARLAARHSSDGGGTWSADTVIATPGEDEAWNVMSVSLMRMQNGDVGLFYLLRHGWQDMRMHLRRSADEGRTWGEPVCCMAAAGYYVVNNDRVVRLSSGRLIIPAALHRARADRNESSSRDWRGMAFFFLSDNDGRTWREAPGHCSLPVPHTRSGLQEPGVVELPNGVLWGWSRTDLGRQYEFFSSDGGETWTVPAPSRFTSPNSPLSMKRIPGTDRMLAVWNPAPSYETRPVRPVSRDRTPLVAATGVGTGSKWKPAFIVDGEDAANAGYCYTAIHFTRDAVLLAYCAGGEADKNSLARLRISRLPLSRLQ